MILLLTNDDGVLAPGLQALRAACEEAESVEVYVVAPERERSATGHAITLHKPLHVHPVQLPGSRSPMWRVNGTPADCVKLGVLGLLDRRPDLVISGINRGSNCGMDVLYSGTVSAAIEGAILGISSLAVSLATLREDADYSAAARFALELARQVAAHKEEGPVLLNVNVPHVDRAAIAGVRCTRLGVRYYQDVIHPRRDPRGRTYYWLAGEPREGENDDETDLGALSARCISVTPLQLNLTAEAERPRIARWLAACTAAEGGTGGGRP